MPDDSIIGMLKNQVRKAFSRDGSVVVSMEEKREGVRDVVDVKSVIAHQLLEREDGDVLRLLTGERYVHPEDVRARYPKPCVTWPGSLRREKVSWDVQFHGDQDDVTVTCPLTVRCAFETLCETWAPPEVMEPFIVEHRFDANIAGREGLWIAENVKFNMVIGAAKEGESAIHYLKEPTIMDTEREFTRKNVAGYGWHKGELHHDAGPALPAWKRWLMTEVMKRYAGPTQELRTFVEQLELGRRDECDVSPWDFVDEGWAQEGGEK